jgi:hypothetical protein
LIPIPLTRGDEWRLGPAVLKQDGEPVPNPEAYAVTASINWPGGSLPINAGNGRLIYGDGQWLIIIQEVDTLGVPLGRVARLRAQMIAPDGITITSQPVTLEIRLP